MICPPNHISVAPDLNPLMTLYCMCPAAAKFLTSGRTLPNIRIETTSAHMASTMKNETHSYIYIPEKNIQKTRGLTALVVEFFNSKPFSDKSLFLEKKLHLGCVGMDTFALQREEIEREDVVERVSLHDRCQEIWGNDLIKEEERDPILKAFYLEVSGHTNVYRNLWIEHIQKTYCEKHPDDNRSCKTKKTDLIDSYIIEKMESKKRLKTMAKSVCKLYPCAHQNVKNYRIYKEMVDEYCPQAFKPKDCSQKPIAEDPCPELNLKTEL